MNFPPVDFEASSHDFTFLTNHTHVLVAIAKTPDIRMRDIAAEVGITERAVQRIVEDLSAIGYLTIIKDGRRNLYEIQADRPLMHPLSRHRNIGDLIRLIFPEFKD
jgi:Mn-dependent DtxR family transcriptional regulator